MQVYQHLILINFYEEFRIYLFYPMATKYRFIYLFGDVMGNLPRWQHSNLNAFATRPTMI